MKFNSPLMCLNSKIEPEFDGAADKISTVYSVENKV